MVSTSLFSFYWVLEDVQLAELCDERMDVLPEHVTLDVKRLIESLDDRLLILGLWQRVSLIVSIPWSFVVVSPTGTRIVSPAISRLTSCALSFMCFSSFHTHSASALQ